MKWYSAQSVRWYAVQVSLFSLTFSIEFELTKI